MKKAKRFLGRYFSLEGAVIRGESRGRQLGFPTANISIEKRQILPKEGVYATYVSIEENTYLGATSIGKNPTFSANNVSVETFILDYSGNLYDKKIGIAFVESIREQIRFDNVEDLKNQLRIDVKNVKKYLHSS